MREQWKLVAFSFSLRLTLTRQAMARALTHTRARARFYRNFRTAEGLCDYSASRQRVGFIEAYGVASVRPTSSISRIHPKAKVNALRADNWRAICRK